MLSGGKRLLIVAAGCRVRGGVDGELFVAEARRAAADGASRTNRDEGRRVRQGADAVPIDPISDNIFDAVTYESTKKGVVETVPKTDEDWEKVKIGAVDAGRGDLPAEAPAAMAPPADVNNSTGPNPPELSPAQIQAKVDADPVLWDAKIQALRNVAPRGDRHRGQARHQVALRGRRDLDKACETCHLEDRYPGDRKAVEEDERQRARIEKSEIRPPKRKK